LENAGYHVQVNPRQINCFYLADGIRGRIISTDQGFKVFQTDIRFTESELLNELDLHPERFSPNVVLRPLFQEFILPNLTYVGGAGELSYWLQYRDYFNQMGVNFPMLCLRNHMLWMDHGTAQRLEQLQVLPQDLFHSIDDLINAHVLANADANVSIEEQKELVSKAYMQLADTALKLDASLVDAIEAERIKVLKGFEQWEGRFTRSLKKKQEVTVNRIRKIEQKLFPNGLLQERHDNFLEPYAKSGTQLFNQMLSAIEPFNTQFAMVVSDH
jgi:bacillithiol biosynthesis cysteine-adding enzyme BshC